MSHLFSPQHFLSAIFRFNLEAKMTETDCYNCSCDFLSVYNGHVAKTELMIGYAVCKIKPLVDKSSGSQLSLLFSTDSTISDFSDNYGFKFTYSTRMAMFCAWHFLETFYNILHQRKATKVLLESVLNSTATKSLLTKSFTLTIKDASGNSNQDRAIPWSNQACFNYRSWPPNQFQGSCAHKINRDLQLV